VRRYLLVRRTPELSCDAQTFTGLRQLPLQLLAIPHIVRDRSIVQLCRRTISLIQIGANGEVQPLETG
jgi:hypothetical protein